MKLRKQSSTDYPICFLMVDSTDHVTAETGLSPTVTISKNGGSFASPSGTVSEVGSGWYKLAGNATDRNTLGELLIHATATGADPVDDRYEIVAWDPFSANVTDPRTVEGSLDEDEVLRILLAEAAGKSSGGGTDTIKFRNQADNADRITATVDQDGNRTAITLNAA